jgi:hypothetical protein
MPKKIQVDPENFYAKPKNRGSVFDCLREFDTDWQFVPGEDFKKGTPPRNFLSRLRSWRTDNGIVAGMRHKILENGSIVVRLYELTPEEIVAREKASLRMKKTMAAYHLSQQQDQE